MKNSFVCNNTESFAVVGRISYLNVAPVYHSLDNGLKPGWLKMITAPPSVLNSMLERDLLDISPVSSSAYARNQERWLLLPDLSIACYGKVMSVILASNYPFNKLNNKKVVLTDESETAAELLKLIFSLKKIKPVFQSRAIKNPGDIQNGTAALIIGDSALYGKWSSAYKYIWDLGDVWHQMTGLPFIFAIWAVRKSFAEKRPEVVASIINLFRISKNKGICNLEQVANKASAKLGLSVDICRKYYKNLFYDLDPLKIKGLEAFFKGLYKAKLIPKKVRLSFFDLITK